MRSHEEEVERPECQRALLHWGALPEFALPPVVEVYAEALCEQDQAQDPSRELVR